MGVAVLDQIAAVVLAGPFLAFPDDLFERGDTGCILGVQSDVIQPLLPTIGSVGTIDGSHRDAGKKGVGGIHDHFGNLGLNNQIQAKIKTVLGGVTMLIGFRKLGGVLGDHVAFKGILHAGCIGGKSRVQSVDQGIGDEEMIAGLRKGGGNGISIIVGQPDGGEQIAGLVVGKLVEDHILMGAVRFGLAVGANVSDLDVAELDALHRVPVALLTVAEIVNGAVVQHCFQRSIADAGGNVAVDHGGSSVVGIGTGEIILVDVDGAGAGKVDGRLRHGGGAGGDRQREQDGQRHQDCAEALDRLFHTVVPFLKLNLEVVRK